MSSITSQVDQGPKSKSFVLPQQSNAADVKRVLESSWLYNQKEVIRSKLLAAQKLKREKLLDERTAALQLERTVSSKLCKDLLYKEWQEKQK